MTEYQKTYIELKKQFVATNEGSDNVRALYTFKEELEQSEDQQAKEVLVDVYDLLDFKKDAYELLCQIGNRSDKKTLKRLGTLKDYAENWGNHYALPKPKTPEEKQNCGCYSPSRGAKNASISPRVQAADPCCISRPPPLPPSAAFISLHRACTSAPPALPNAYL